MSSGPATGRGAYGLRWAGVHSDDLVQDPPPEWPLVRVTTRIGEPRTERPSFGADAARMDLPPDADVELDRLAGTAAYVAPRPIGPDELVHPHLSKAAAVFAVWTGRAAIHAGAFVHAGRAWGVLGAREAGKSTLLARLALAGVPVVADDLLVVREDLAVHPGPRCIDLRPASAERIASARTVPSRQGQRSRLPLPPIDAAVPLGGWVVLEWGPDTAVERAPASELLHNLVWRRLYGLTPPRAEIMLDLTALPALRFARARDWDAEAEAIERLLTAVGT